jgi:aminopeptidase YwaD
MLGMCIVQLTGVVAGNASMTALGTLDWILMTYPIIPSVILAMLYNTGSIEGGIVPGAADNLAASALTVAMSRFLVKNPEYVPADTEIRFISFGSEEAGLRGSRRYVESHLNELKQLDARLLNMEIIAYPEIGILTSEVNGTVKNSPELVESIVAAADRAGVPYKAKSAYLGVSSDAGPFSRAGLKAVTLNCFKVPQQMLAFYHQRTDTPEVLTVEPLSNVLKLISEWIRNGGQ